MNAPLPMLALAGGADRDRLNAYLDACNRAERVEPELSRTLDAIPSTRVNAAAEAMLYIAAAVGALQESGGYSDITADAVADLQRIVRELDDELGEHEPGWCLSCSGSGEGSHEGATCLACRGSGSGR